MFDKNWPGKPIGPAAKSLSDVLAERLIDPIVDKVAGRLSKETRTKLKEAARDAVTSGIAKGARSAAERAGIHDAAELDAIENATKAAIQEKEKTPQ